MSDTVISCHGLGKKYVLNHSVSQGLLRDRIAGWFRPAKKNDAASREDFWALRDVAFDIKRGDVVGIVGRNGAGKSTLLKILSRITEPSTGVVNLRGRVASLLEVGTGFHPELTGRENVFLNGSILGMSRREIRSKFDEIVEFAEVQKFIDTPVKHYSSGMYVRLAFSVAAHLEPEILIIDEVLAVGDVQFQQKCLGKMGDVSRKDGRTILFVSHNLKAVQSLCNRAIVLRSGQVYCDGSTNEGVSAYLSLGQQPQGGISDRALNDELTLRSFTFSPSPARTRSSTSFSLSLRATKACQLQDLSMLFYNQHHERVAIADLRVASGPRSLEQGASLTLSGKISPLNLIEGRYSVGLFVRTARQFADYLELLEMDIEAAEPVEGLLAYDPKYLGATSLDFTFTESVSGT